MASSGGGVKDDGKDKMGDLVGMDDPRRGNVTCKQWAVTG